MRSNVGCLPSVMPSLTCTQVGALPLEIRTTPLEDELALEERKLKLRALRLGVEEREMQLAILKINEGL